ncbi:type I asparaginase [Eggerthellaceae bacterium 3-80]|nr:type I asparaginase [bacterium D16-34]
MPTTTLTKTQTPHIMVIYTGGTIGMIEDARTGALAPFTFDHLIANVPKIGRLGFKLSHYEFDPPIDSSNMNPQLWKTIAEVIEANYNDVDGFVILHGTDTMAYTASALSFMLEGLAKPVILTGSQLPIGEIREDGTENVITALQIAAERISSGEHSGQPMIQEVAISFGRHLWRGCRATKESSTDFGAFRSFNYPPLADMDLHICYRTDYLRRVDPHTSLTLQTSMSQTVGIISVYPGLTQATLKRQLETPGMQGFILRTFGAGNAPCEPWFVDPITQAVKDGKVLVNITQCPAGGVEQKRYATGDALAHAGVITGLDMTCEAALTKLMSLFGRGLTSTQVAQLMTKSLVGELSE